MLEVNVNVDGAVAVISLVLPPESVDAAAAILDVAVEIRLETDVREEVTALPNAGA